MAGLILTLVKFPSIAALYIYLNFLRFHTITVYNIIKHLPDTLSNISKSSEKRNLTKYSNTAIYSFSASCFSFISLFGFPHHIS